MISASPALIADAASITVLRPEPAIWLAASPEDGFVAGLDRYLDYVEEHASGFAAVLGAGFIAFAVLLLRRGGNKVAWQLYKYSSLYLALMFVALVVDRLVSV